MKHLLLIVLATVLVFIGCGDGDSSGEDNNEEDGDSIECEGIRVWYDSEEDICWSTEDVFQVNWSQAMEFCDELEVDDYDDWKLPNIDQLRSLVAGCAQIEPGGACPIQDGSSMSEWTSMCDGTDECGVMEGPGSMGCFHKPDIGSNCGPWWSSSEDASNSDEAFYIHFNYAQLYAMDKNNDSNESARCVRAPE